jgi:hypothetical protein
MVRVGAITLVTLSIFNWEVKFTKLEGLFVALILIFTMLVVLVDIYCARKMHSATIGKKIPLSEANPELDALIKEEWKKHSEGKKLECVLIDGNSGHSNAYVTRT